MSARSGRYIPTLCIMLCSCCVDEVAAEHVGAECIVHYGSACLSPSKRLPLMYVFERRPVDLEKCASAFRELYPDARSHVILLYHVNYVHSISKLFYGVVVGETKVSFTGNARNLTFTPCLLQMSSGPCSHQSIQTLSSPNLLPKQSGVALTTGLKYTRTTSVCQSQTAASPSVSLEGGSP